MGYAQKETASSGNAMLSAQFATVSANDGSATLADLTVSGYDPYDPVEDEGGTSGDFNIQFLSSSGTMEARYYWYDDDEKTGWFDRTGVSADAVKLDAGKGVWTSGRGLTLTSAGAVNESDIVIVTRSSGNQAIANTTPVALKLSQLAITGYDPYDPEEDEGGTSGDFNIQFLSSSGTMVARYYWYDDDEKTGWFDRTGESAANVEIPAGTGVWASGKGLTIRIPAPELNQLILCRAWCAVQITNKGKTKNEETNNCACSGRNGSCG